MPVFANLTFIAENDRLRFHGDRYNLHIRLNDKFPSHSLSRRKNTDRPCPSATRSELPHSIAIANSTPGGRYPMVTAFADRGFARHSDVSTGSVGRRVKILRRTQNVEKHGVSRRQMIAFPWLDFIRRHRTLACFGAEHALCPPAMAHPAGLSLRPREPTSATDH